MLPIIAGLISTLGKGVLGSAVTAATNVVDQLVEDKDLALKLKAELAARVMETDLTEFVNQINASRDVLVAEISGESWLQRNWRPLVMMMFASVIANNYIIFPYLSLFPSTAGMVTKLDLPPFLWECIKLGLSGYVIGRSMEKIAAGNGIKAIAKNLMNGADN